MTAWTVETAKARLSEVMREAREVGPQHISLRGKPSVVVMSEEAYARMTKPGGSKTSWVDEIREQFIGDVDLERDMDGGRDIDFDL